MNKLQMEGTFHRKTEDVDGEITLVLKIPENNYVNTIAIPKKTNLNITIEWQGRMDH